MFVSAVFFGSFVIIQLAVRVKPLTPGNVVFFVISFAS